MPIPLHDAIDEAADLAVAKVEQTRSLPRYMINSAFAGAYVGVAVVLLVSVSAPLAAAGSPFARLIGAAVFGIALTLVVFAGAELFTGNNMFMLQGLYLGKVRATSVAAVWGASLLGNLVGSVAFAALVHGAGTLALGVSEGERGPGETLLAQIVETKTAAAGGQLFWRAVLCNMLVCLALWMAGRTKNDMAKLGVLWWGLLAFIASGFEHSVANMTIFALGRPGRVRRLGRARPQPAVDGAGEYPRRRPARRSGLRVHCPRAAAGGGRPVACRSRTAPACYCCLRGRISREEADGADGRLIGGRRRQIGSSHGPAVTAEVAGSSFLPSPHQVWSGSALIYCCPPSTAT